MGELSYDAVCAQLIAQQNVSGLINSMIQSLPENLCKFKRKRLENCNNNLISF